MQLILRIVLLAFALEQQHRIPWICYCHVFMLIYQVDISLRNRVIHRVNFQQIFLVYRSYFCIILCSVISMFLCIYAFIT